VQQALEAHRWPGGEQARVRLGVHAGGRRRRPRAWWAWMCTAPGRTLSSEPRPAPPWPVQSPPLAKGS
jgi:hypothetical protein